MNPRTSLPAQPRRHRLADDVGVVPAHEDGGHRGAGRHERRVAVQKRPGCVTAPRPPGQIDDAAREDVAGDGKVEIPNGASLGLQPAPQRLRVPGPVLARHIERRADHTAAEADAVAGAEHGVADRDGPVGQRGGGGGGLGAAAARGNGDRQKDGQHGQSHRPSFCKNRARLGWQLRPGWPDSRTGSCAFCFPLRPRGL
jgi:hypothetical protein